MPPRKRVATESIDTPRRSSRRVSSTPQKSRYFEDSDNETDHSDPPPKKRGRGRPPKVQALKKEESEEEFREEPEEENESEEEDVDEEDAPPKVTVIPLEKMRDTGGVEYEDEKLHQNTMLFLKDLKANNRRPWLKAHDGEYRRALKDWESFVERSTQTIVEADETIPELPVKDVIFRIYRDIRFSKNPTPYKPHFSAAWSRTGRKGPYACYYIHCEPKASFIGGGLWFPEASHIHKLRASIDERPNRWRRVLNEPGFKRTFLPGVKAGAKPEAALKAFAEKNKGNALKTKPKGYIAEHRDIELLKLRNFTVGTKIDEDMLCGDDAQEKLTEIIRPMVGFISFLNSVVMPDPGADDDDSEEEDGGGGEEEVEDEDEED
ncbi:Fc.00g060250.m01.CDS01 [Cosmosporella sp. VM-42]